MKDEWIEAGARAIMARSGIKWESKVRHEALKHSRAALEAVIPLVIADTIPKPKNRTVDRHRPGYYAEYRNRRAKLKEGQANE